MKWVDHVDRKNQRTLEDFNRVSADEMYDQLNRRYWLTGRLVLAAICIFAIIGLLVDLALG